MISIAEMSHSREQETDADTFGIEMASAVYGRDKNLLEFFYFVSKKESKDLLYNLNRSHPYPQDRVKALEKLLN